VTSAGLGRLFHKCLKDCFSKRFDIAAWPEVCCQCGQEERFSSLGKSKFLYFTSAVLRSRERFELSDDPPAVVLEVKRFVFQNVAPH